MNLLDFEFGVFPRGCQANASPVGIDGIGNFETPVNGVPEDLSHHQDNVLVGVVIVVPKNDVKSWLTFWSFVFFIFWLYYRIGGQRC